MNNIWRASNNYKWNFGKVSVSLLMNKYLVENFVDPTNINLKNVDTQSWNTFQQKLNESAPFWPIQNPSFKEMYVVRKQDGNWYRAKEGF